MFLPRTAVDWRRFVPTVEPLEGREVPAGVRFNFTIDDPTNAFAAYPLLRSNLEAAGEILSGVLAGQGSMDVVVRPSDVERAGGTVVAMVYGATQDGTYVYDHGTVSEVRTGTDPNGAVADIELLFNPRDYLSLCWFDPSGAARTAPLPADRIDFLSVAVHETLHALGYQGYRALEGAGYGTFPDLYRSRFDSLTHFGAGGDASVLYFVGVNAVSLYGGPIPLTSWGATHAIRDENFYHVGNAAGRPGSELIGDMMNGVEFRRGRRYQITSLDLVMLADMGWSLTPQAPAAARDAIERNRPKPPPPAPTPPPPLTGDVTAWVRVSLGRARYNARTRQYERAVTLRNLVDRTLAGPLVVLFELADRTSRRRRVLRVAARFGVTLASGGSVTAVATSPSAAWGSTPIATQIVAGG